VGVGKMLLGMMLQIVENRYDKFDHFRGVNIQAV
jgi:hypothetical protein